MNVTDEVRHILIRMLFTNQIRMAQQVVVTVRTVGVSLLELLPE